MGESTLFVVLGAGASFDAATTPPGVPPPLVSQLFAPSFNDILDQYPMAKNAAPDIRDAIKDREGVAAVSLEDHLRLNYVHSEDELDRRRYFSIVLYLQHVLWWVSVPDQNGQGRFDPDNMLRLINRVLASWDHVCFITLNYDLVLDRCLADLDPLDTMSKFIAYPRWSLIKLHGSVTWKFKIEDPDGVQMNNPPADLDRRLARDRILHTWSLGHADLRYAQDDLGRHNGFPALAAPLGPEDELVCPPEHEEFVRQRLASADGIDLLVVGYSAYDQSVLKLIRESGNRLRTLFVVGADADMAGSVVQRIAEGVGHMPLAAAVGVHGGFGDWAKSGLASYPEWVRARR
jgi:hypothetical protein